MLLLPVSLSELKTLRKVKELDAGSQDLVSIDHKRTLSVYHRVNPLTSICT